MRADPVMAIRGSDKVGACSNPLEGTRSAGIHRLRIARPVYCGLISVMSPEVVAIVASAGLKTPLLRRGDFGLCRLLFRRDETYGLPGQPSVSVNCPITLECSRRPGVGRESQRRSSRLDLGVMLQDCVLRLRWWPAADSYVIQPPSYRASAPAGLTESGPRSGDMSPRAQDSWRARTSASARPICV